MVGFWQAPKAEDRAQVVSREVRLPNAPPTILDDQDAQIVSSQAISTVVTRNGILDFSTFPLQTLLHMGFWVPAQNKNLCAFFLCCLDHLQALKLSDDYNLNEIDCVGLIVSAHQEVGKSIYENIHFPFLALLLVVVLVKTMDALGCMWDVVAVELVRAGTIGSLAVGCWALVY